VELLAYSCLAQILDVAVMQVAVRHLLFYAASNEQGNNQKV
jgi:hypothetical protein